MLSTLVFGISLAFLLTLFGCKMLEQNFRVRTPLIILRRAGDPVIRDIAAGLRRTSRTWWIRLVRVSTISLKASAHKTRLSFDEVMHTFAMHLNRYLRGRRVKTQQNGGVSTHLKTVLEKTEKNTAPPNSL